jgi:hypothetical protein
VDITSDSVETIVLLHSQGSAVSVSFARSRLRPPKAIPVWAPHGVCRVVPTFYFFHPFYMAIVKKSSAVRGASKPVKAFRMRGISVSVFANDVQSDDGRELTFHNISVQRRYRDGDEFKTTTSFRRDDLPILQLLVQRAWEYVVDAEAKAGADDEETV